MLIKTLKSFDYFKVSEGLELIPLLNSRDQKNAPSLETSFAPL